MPCKAAYSPQRSKSILKERVGVMRDNGGYVSTWDGTRPRRGCRSLAPNLAVSCITIAPIPERPLPPSSIGSMTVSFDRTADERETRGTVSKKDSSVSNLKLRHTHAPRTSVYELDRQYMASNLSSYRGLYETPLSVRRSPLKSFEAGWRGSTAKLSGLEELALSVWAGRQRRVGASAEDQRV